MRIQPESNEGIFVFKDYSMDKEKFTLDYFIYKDENEKLSVMDIFESQKYLLFPRISSLEHLKEICSISVK